MPEFGNALGRETVKDESGRTDPMRLAKHDVIAEPFPHIIKDAFIAHDLYARLRTEFPSDEVFSNNTTVGGRSGRDLYRGDKVYEELLKTSPAWREFSEYINSPDYMEVALELFGEFLSQYKCAVDSQKARFVDYIEPREMLEDKSRVKRGLERVARLLERAEPANELFARLDLAQGSIGYGKPVHCDRPNRLTSMIVYFCDAEDIGLEGGDLLLHEHAFRKPYDKYERHPKPDAVRVCGRVVPKENRGVFFLCSNNSYHSATAVKAQRSFRNFIYVSISSRAPVIW